MVQRQNFIPEGYVDLVEAARILQIHYQSLRRLIKQQRVPGVILTRGKYLFNLTELRQFAGTYDKRLTGKYTVRNGTKPWS